MDIPINVQVDCTDGHGGVSTAIILNPVTEEVTHVVVKENDFPHVERLVPLSLVIEGSPHLIRLRCSRSELSQMQSFTDTEYITPETSEFTDPYVMLPYAVAEGLTVPIEHEEIPPDELAIHRGAEVRATDGKVGRVDEFLVNPVNCHINHLVMREGHFW